MRQLAKSEVDPLIRAGGFAFQTEGAVGVTRFVRFRPDCVHRADFTAITAIRAVIGHLAVQQTELSRQTDQRTEGAQVAAPKPWTDNFQNEDNTNTMEIEKGSSRRLKESAIRILEIIAEMVRLKMINGSNQPKS